MDGRCPRRRPCTLGQRAHCIGLLDQYGSPTKCKKVRSCDIYHKYFYSTVTNVGTTTAVPQIPASEETVPIAVPHKDRDGDGPQR